MKACATGTYSAARGCAWARGVASRGRTRLLSVFALTLVSILMGCANNPHASDADGVEGESPATASAAVQAYAQQLRKRAAAAETRGDWADAVLAYEIIGLLRPADQAMQQRGQAARQHLAASLARHEAAAQAAQQRGDADAARTAWLQVLALDPGNPAAADALRHIERVQSNRSAAGRFTHANPAPAARRSKDGGPVSSGAPGSSPGAAAGAPRRPAARSTSR